MIFFKSNILIGYSIRFIFYKYLQTRFYFRYINYYNYVCT